MPFISEIWKYSSLSVAGLEKNTGKTECLNYILNRMKDSGKTVAVTSIGIDGEGIDQVTHTHKPEIEIYRDMIFTTSEKHYKSKLLTAEIMAIGSKHTSLGRLVTARAKTQGKVLLSGPTDSVWLQELLTELRNLNVVTTLVDGALSRLSLSAPTVTEAMVLATGAALSSNISELVKKTTFTYTLIQLQQVAADLRRKLAGISKGIWAIDNDNQLHDLNIVSALSIESYPNLFEHGSKFFVAGAVSDKLLNYLRIQKQVEQIEVVVKDFSRLFISPDTYSTFISKGGKISVLQQPSLLAICVNPVAPNGYRLNSDDLISRLKENIHVPIYDIKQL